MVTPVTAAALEVVGLRVAYGSREVLRGVSLAVVPGEVVGLVGANGCGKTTLLKAVTRTVPALGGTVAIGGSATNRLSRRELAIAVAVVPQSAGIPGEVTGLEAVLMGRTPHIGFFGQETRDDVDIAHAALERAGAGEFAHRRVRELSGGERQTVLVARALAQGSRVLLLDEPTASLDIGHQMDLFELVRRLAHTEGFAVLAALHDLTLASLYCDRLILLSAGLVVADGSPDEVLTEANIESAYGARTTLLRIPGSAAPVVVPYAGDPR